MSTFYVRWLPFLRFRDLDTQMLHVKRWWNWPQAYTFDFPHAHQQGKQAYPRLESTDQVTYLGAIFYFLSPSGLKAKCTPSQSIPFCIFKTNMGLKLLPLKLHFDKNTFWQTKLNPSSYLNLIMFIKHEQMTEYCAFKIVHHFLKW